MTVADIVKRAHSMARFNVAETDPFTESEWTDAVNRALVRLWDIAPEAFFVSGRVCAMPVIASTNVPILETYAERVAAAAAKDMLLAMPSGDDQVFMQERDALADRLELTFQGGTNGGRR